MPPTLRSAKRKRSDEQHQPSEAHPKRRALQSTVPRKRSIEQRERQGQCWPRPLTAQSLDRVPRDCSEQRVSRWEGRDTVRLRNMSSSATGSGSNPRKRSRRTASTLASASSLPTSVPSERTSTYHKHATDVFMDNNIFGPSYRVDPANKAALLDGLARARRSLSPSLYPDSKFEAFVRANHKALNEGQLVSEVVHPYFTSYFDHAASTDLAFTSLEPVVPAPLTMPPPKPDHSFGAAKEDIHATVRHALDRYIICAPGCQTPAAVNDMMQVKGPDGKASVLETQITQDGAVGERAMHQLHSYARGSAYTADGVAHTFVQSYHAGTMKYYVAHRSPRADASGTDRVYTTEIAGQYLCGSPSQLRDGIKMYRNSVEMAAQCRRQAVDDANARAIQSALTTEESDIEESNELYDVPT
ncbi:hypothetical protein AC579_1105 [Pseudocercospora musae]|uniref:Uncharacterized protein n=1 Tax=Pseudocercospora musae TaxID=113226 RepID=A0A139I058_9PEZI|nr:hypothetical protein AC579_1105 [Pseudocercospora musae]